MTIKKDFQTTLESIKTRGYWSVNLYPSKVLQPVANPITNLKETMRTTTIQLRGWDYPHFPTNNLDHQAMYISGECVEAWVDMDQFKEVWRMFNNGQFIHLFGLREDWWSEDSWLSADHPLKQIKPNTVLEVIHTTYSLTEMYAFFRNAVEVMYPDDVDVCIEISLIGTEGRKLQVSDPGRIPLFWGYECHTPKVVFPKKIYTKKQMLENYVDLAFEQIQYILGQFNWDNAPLQVVKEDQKKLIERRI